jgi:hypothetical protein
MLGTSIKFTTLEIKKMKSTMPKILEAQEQLKQVVCEEIIIGL